MQISFSGGRTSGYMTKLLLDNLSNEYDFIVTFANTGLEHSKTLDFVNNCDKYFGFNTVWLEADVYHGERKGTSFKIVDYASASRNGEPYEQMIKKYGIPGVTHPHCTRELKLAPMRSYLKSLNVHHTTIPTAIGIRNDETRRISPQAEANNIVYPLIHMWPADKQDVLDWWEDQLFDLDIEEWEGNCRLCFKKSLKKQFKQLDTDVSIVHWYKKMEYLYSSNGSNKEVGFKRAFFRNNLTIDSLVGLWEQDRKGNPTPTRLNPYEDSGCSESCEVYETV